MENGEHQRWRLSRNDRTIISGYPAGLFAKTLEKGQRVLCIPVGGPWQCWQRGRVLGYADVAVSSRAGKDAGLACLSENAGSGGS